MPIYPVFYLLKGYDKARYLQPEPGPSYGLLMTSTRSTHDIWGFPKITGTILGGPYNKDYSILGSILGSPYI